MHRDVCIARFAYTFWVSKYLELTAAFELNLVLTICIVLCCTMVRMKPHTQSRPIWKAIGRELLSTKVDPLHKAQRVLVLIIMFVLNLEWKSIRKSSLLLKAL